MIRKIHGVNKKNTNNERKMTDSSVNKKYPVILGCILIMVILGGYLLYGAFVLSPNEQIPVPATTVPGSSIPTVSPQQSGDYCYINELHSDLLGDSIIIPLTPEDLEKFPEYGAVIIQSGNNSRKWINGYRLAGDFTDYQHQIYNFRNLSCRNISYEECKARLLPVVYEYERRYYDVACLEDFGGAHRSRDNQDIPPIK